MHVREERRGREGEKERGEREEDYQRRRGTEKAAAPAWREVAGVKLGTHGRGRE